MSGFVQGTGKIVFPIPQLMFSGGICLLVLAALLAAALTARLGVWQLDRAAHKLALQAAIDAEAARAWSMVSMAERTVDRSAGLIGEATVGKRCRCPPRTPAALSTNPRAVCAPWA